MKTKSTNFKYYQPNEKDIKDNYGDCLIRGLTKFYNITWIEAFDRLVVYARRSQTILNSIETLRDLLSDDQIEYNTIYKERIRVSDFAKKHKEGKYLLYVRTGFSTHIVASEGGIFYDTWDSGNKLVYGYWYKEV